MNASDRRALKLITQSKGDVRASLLSFLSKPKHYKKPIQKAREAKEQKERLSMNGETAAIRAACVKRGHGFCENPRCAYYGVEMDHWMGGNGRRRQRQAVENCWMLCRRCHGDRQSGSPSAAYWNSIFEKHCSTYGYIFEGHIEHAALPRKSSRALGLGQRVPPSQASSPDALDLPKVNQ